MADVYETIINAATRHGVPVEALLAIAKIESKFTQPHLSFRGTWAVGKQIVHIAGSTSEELVALQPLR